MYSVKTLKIVIFFLVLCSTAFFYQGANPNTNSRFNLSRALSEEGSISIDRFAPNTVDKASYNGHYYSDKAPGVAFAGAAILLVANPIIKIFISDARIIANTQLYVVCFFILSLLTALTAVLFFKLAISVWGERKRFLAFFLTALVFLGTFIFPYATVLFSHQVAGNLLFIIFYYLREMHVKKTEQISRVHALWIAFLCAYLALVEYPLAVPAGIAYLYLLVRLFKFRKSLCGLAFIPGLLITMVLLIYNYHAFGSPFSIGYERLQGTPFEEGMSQGFFGLTLPTWNHIYHLLFSGYRGLFFYNPILLFSFIGLYYWIKRRSVNYGEGLVILGAFLYFLLLNASYSFWQGGACIGPRHIVPTIVLLSVGFLYVPRSLLVSPIFLLASFISWLFMLLGSSVSILPKEAALNPYWDIIIPWFKVNKLSMNPFPILEDERYLTSFNDMRWASFNSGEFVLNGKASLLPLLVFQSTLLAVVLSKPIKNYLQRFLAVINSKQCALKSFFTIGGIFNYVALSLVVIFILQKMYPGDGKFSFMQDFRIVTDPSDIMVYMERGIWAVKGLKPYIDVFAEYPIIPILIFGGISFLVSYFTGGFQLFYFCHLLTQFASIAAAAWVFFKKSSAKMSLIFFVLVFLPASVYFGMNRFDMMFAVGIGLLVHVVFKRNYVEAGILLSLLFFVKWISLLYLPILLLFIWNHDTAACIKVKFDRVIKFCVGAVVTLTVGGLLLYAWLGVESFWVPIRWQMARDPSHGALLYYVLRVLSLTTSKGAAVIASHLSSVLQFAVCLIPVGFAIKRLGVKKAFSNASLITSLLFINNGFALFSKIYSPQWILWDLFLWFFLMRELVNEGRLHLNHWVMCISGNVVSYLFFPIFWDLLVPTSSEFFYLGFVCLMFRVFYLEFILRLSIKEFQRAASNVSC